MESIMKKLYLALVLSSFLIMVGCSEKTSDEYIAIAEINIQQNDISSAIIELKNAIRVNPRDPKSRFMLGNLYANRGSSVSAEKELKRAFELGYEPNEVLPLLANVYSLQFEHEEIIRLVDESRNISPEVSTSLLLYKALAHFQLGETYKAEKAVADANEISSDSLYSQLGNAYVDFSNQQIDTSLEKINEILIKQPDFADAYLLKGQLSSVSNEKESAVKSFEKYKELLPETFQARVFLANAYIKNEQFELAEQELDILLQLSPEQPFINQLKGFIRYQFKDFVSAKFFTEVAIQNGLSSPANLIIAGLSNFQQKKYEQAYVHLSAVSDELSREHPIQKILSILSLKLGYYVEASDDLIQMVNLSENDIVFLSAASTKLTSQGKMKQAKAVADRAKSLDFTNPIRLAEKGMMLLSLGDIDGITDLKHALALNPELDSANSVLAKAYLDSGSYDEALKLAEVWIELKPTQVNGYLLSALAYSKLGKEIDSNLMFKKVLQIDEANPAANFYYADKALVEKQFKKSSELIKQVVLANPNFTPALAKYFVTQKYTGNVQESMKAIQTAYENNSTIINYRILYAQALYSEKQFSQCIDLLDNVKLNEILPSGYWGVLANAYFYNNEERKSIATVKKWMRLEPSNINPYLLIISLNEMNSDYKGALAASLEAKALFDQEPQFMLFATYFYIATNKTSKAYSEWQLMPPIIQNSVVGQGLLGQILIGQKQAEKALPMLKTLFETYPNVRNRSFVANALQLTQKNKQAIVFLQQNVELKGGKTIAHLQIAELAISLENYTLAADEYKKLLAFEPNNLRALNNLAHLFIEQNRFDDALKYSKAALDLRPNIAAIVDTYGLALLRSNRASDAIIYFERAIKIEPQSGEMKLHYAEALALANRQSEAAVIVNKIVATDPQWQAKLDRVKDML